MTHADKIIKALREKIAELESKQMDAKETLLCDNWKRSVKLLEKEIK